MANSPVFYIADRSARAALLVEHNAVLSLCLVWEHLADALPKVPGKRRWANLSASFEAFRDYHLPRIQHALGEIAEAEELPGHFTDFIERLAGLTLIDADHSRDVEAALAALLLKSNAAHAETVGYMLRCLFEGCRRTILAREILLAAIGLPK